MDISQILYFKHMKHKLERDKDSMSSYVEQMYAHEYKNILDEIKKEARLDRAYMDMAISLSQLSWAERAKVGCIIVSEDGQIVSQGYNGTPSGFDNCCEEEGCDHALVTKKEVLHAESNAISKCAKWGGSTDGATLYVTLSPCFECAKLIIQAGIKRVVYDEVYRDNTGIELLEKAGVNVWKCCKPEDYIGQAEERAEEITNIRSNYGK